MKMVYHYAPWAYLPAMVDAGFLRPSSAGADGETPLLWFSANQHWEPTATKVLQTDSGELHQLTFGEQLQKFGCIRFGLNGEDPRLLAWKQACEAAGIGRDARRGLERVGKKKGAKSEDWFATLVPVSLDEIQLQAFINNHWLTGDPIEMADAWRRVRG